MTIRDGDLLAAFFASVDSRIWRADSAAGCVVRKGILTKEEAEKV
jgi:hypothetical protein